MPTPSLRLCLLIASLSFAPSACQKQCPPEFVRDGAFCRVKDDTDAAIASGIAPQAGSAADAWRCEGDATRCSCTPAASAADTCPAPKPSCCFMLEAPTQTCTCWAQDSESCRSAPNMPGAKAVTSCPPS